jgi:hypothetical protein
VQSRVGVIIVVCETSSGERLDVSGLGADLLLVEPLLLLLLAKAEGADADDDGAEEEEGDGDEGEVEAVKGMRISLVSCHKESC